MLFAPLNVAAFIYLPKEIRGAAVGLLALLRNEGGSVGTSVAQIIQERREQFHILRLNESLDTLNPSGQQSFGAGPNVFPATQRRLQCCRIGWRWVFLTNREHNRPCRWPTLTSFSFWRWSVWRWYLSFCLCAVRWRRREPILARNSVFNLK